jgi:hypothetical protein
MLEAVFSVGSVLRLYRKDPRPAERAGNSLELCKEGKRKAEKNGAVFESSVDKSSVAGYSPNSNDVSAGN